VCKFGETSAPSLLQHTGEKPYQCQLCPSAFYEQRFLNTHKALKHNIGVQRRCAVCNKSFGKSEADFENHMRTHTGERPFKCSICPKRFANASNLKAHLTTLSSVARLTCKICGKTYKTARTLKVHSQKHTKSVKKYQCPECPKAYFGYDTSSLYKHIRSVHRNLRPFSCELCGKAFNTKANRDKHVRSHLGERYFKCSKCDYETVHSNSLKSHLQRHASNQSFCCTKCSFEYSTNLELLRHYLKTHVGSDQDLFQCFFCKVEVDCVERLEIHTRKHTNEKPYFCRRCPLDFETIIGLKKHVACEHETNLAQQFLPQYILPAKCNVCGVLCSDARSLKRHMNRHLRGKDVPCTKCDFRFPTELELLKHYLKDHVGSNDNILECLFCRKRSKALLRLEDHTRGHLGEQNYFCNLCENGFVRQGALKRHIKAVHGQDAV